MVRQLKSALVASLAAAIACASAPGPGDAGYAYNVGGMYSGRLHVADDPFDAALSLRTAPGGRITGTLRVVSPIQIDGRVRGNLIDDLLRLTITYRGEDGCDGRIEGILTVAPGGDTIEGPVTVTDCAEPVAATMSLRR